MPIVTELEAGKSKTLKITKGRNQTGELLLLTPQNAFTIKGLGRDHQSAIVSPIFEEEVIVQQMK